MRFVLALLAGLGLAGQAMAAEVFECTVNAGIVNQKGWIAPQIFLAFDMDGIPVQVYDGIIHEFNKEKPLAAKVTSENGTSRNFEWSLHMVNSVGQRTKMQYRGNFFLATKELAISARPIGYADFFTARGRCKPSKS